MKKSGFTLIELIVVITILAILGTIAFIGFKGYTSDARDSKVTTDIAMLSTSLGIYKATEGVVPMPDSPIKVEAGAGNTITYEGEIGDNVRGVLKASSDAKTPFGENYMYAVNGTHKKYTLVGMLEKDTASLITSVSADSDSDIKYFKGAGVLTLFDANNDFIAGDINGAIANLDEAYVGKEEMVVDASKVVQDVPAGIKTNRGTVYASCKEILDKGKANGSGVYNLASGKAYCDMETEGGGWTLIFNKGEDFSDFTDSGSSLCDGYKGDCLNKAWSTVGVSEVMVDGSESPISGDSNETRFILSDTSFGAHTMHYMMNNDGDSPCINKNSWNAGKVSKVIKKDSGMGYDYGTIVRDDTGGRRVCINDLGNDENIFLLGGDWGNSSGWPANIYSKHWHKYYRFWVR